MSKKDYQAIAQAIYRRSDMMKNSQGWPSRAAHYAELAGDIADTLAADNPRFNRALFIEACETGACKEMRRSA